MSLSRAGTYFISAGEQSGDLLAADLVVALREVLPKWRPMGIVGQTMLDAGVEPIGRMETISTMGISDVLRRLPELRMFESQLLARLDNLRPAFAILVDFPGFHLRLAEQLRLRGIPVVQYVAPKVWAWGKSRIENLRRDFDLVLGVLPFEEEFFQKAGVNYRYCGSPHKDRTDKVQLRREDLGLAGKSPLIALLPGSRVEELRLIMPRLWTILLEMRRKNPQVQAIMPLAASLSAKDLQSILRTCGVSSPLQETATGWTLPGLQIFRGMSLEVMKVADAAIVASGTATFECALLGTPMVVVYQMSPLSFAVAKRVVKLPYVSLVNLLAGTRVVSEYLQEFRESDVAAETLQLAAPGEARREMLAAFDRIRDGLDGQCAARAATSIESLALSRGGRRESRE